MQQHWKMSKSDFRRRFIPCEQVSDRVVGEASAEDFTGHSGKRSNMCMLMEIQGVHEVLMEGF